MTAVELLLSGEVEITSNPEMNRGLIAVLNYYSSQKTIVDALRSLLQAQSIIANDNPRASEVLNFIDSYCEGLFKNGLFLRLLSLLENLNIQTEMDMLEKQRALGTAKHRRQFCIIFNNIKETLAECVMLRSFNVPLNTAEMKALIAFIQHSRPEIKTEEGATTNVNGVRNLDKGFLHLLTSVINSMNPVIKGNSVSNCSRDCYNHPFFTEEEYITTINDILQKNIAKVDGTDSIVQNINTLLYLAWSISLQKMSHLKQERSINDAYQTTTNFGDYEDYLENDGFNLGSVNIYDCFSFMTFLVSVDSFHEEVGL